MVAGMAVLVFPIPQRVYHGPTQTYIVHAGDTLYSIIDNLGLDEHTDPRTVVSEIQQLNHMSDVMIQPGEILTVPTE
jgi:LysM repeat protein